MNEIEKSFYKKTAIYFSIAEILCFLAFYIAAFTLPHEITAYAYYYVVEIVDFVVPVFAAFVLYLVYERVGAVGALLRSIPLALTTVIYVFPYHAFAYAYEKMLFTDVLIYSSLQAAITLLFDFARILILTFAIILTVKLASRRKRKTDALDGSAPFDFSSPSCLGIFVATALLFIYKLVFEIYDTVVYITEYRGTYLMNEVIYMSFRYLFILALLLGTHYAVCKIKTRLKETIENE